MSCIDPEVVGGMSVQIGDELIDGSVASRLAAAAAPAGRLSRHGRPGQPAAAAATTDRPRPASDEKDARTMAELTIRPDEIRDALARFVQAYEPDAASTEEVGTVAECGDGIARVEGLPSAMANELLEFEDGIRGLALNLDVREIGVVILGDFSKIEEGQQVRRTGEVLSVPVGDGFLGRVVGPARRAAGRQGRRSRAPHCGPLELQAPSVVQRSR